MEAGSSAKSGKASQLGDAAGYMGEETGYFFLCSTRSALSKYFWKMFACRNSVIVQAFGGCSGNVFLFTVFSSQNVFSALPGCPQPLSWLCHYLLRGAFYCPNGSWSTALQPCLQRYCILLNSFLSLMRMGMILMGPVVSDIVTDEPMNLIFQTIIGF